MQSVLSSGFQIEIQSKLQNNEAVIYLLGHKRASQNFQVFKNIVLSNANELAQEKILTSDKKIISFTGIFGPVWVVKAPELKKGNHLGLLDESNYAWYRDLGATLLGQIKTQNCEEVSIEVQEIEPENVVALLIGFELAQYNFLNHFKKNIKKIKLNIISVTSNKKNKITTQHIAKAQTQAASIQLARHLVNLPPNEVNPVSVEALVRKDLGFATASRVKIDVWDAKKLEQESMHLHLAVGKGSESPPRMVHIQYRPSKKSSKKPIAFVGKGVTFDTGGLDIKPSSAMRLMKKDMGGAAAVLGLAYWVIHSKYERACDFYLALAENSVDAKAMRPSDVYKSRAGYLVEIDNTDAEGRLVLADVMDVAAKQTGVNTPEYLIDLATLTGAIKVALGADVAGLFTNDDKLAAQIQKSGQAVGEPNWRMPLVNKYFSSMSSQFADFKNSGEGFGGAITAALFLEKFSNGLKWAHLDIYAWTDKAQGPYASAGANGQPVQSMIHWLKTVI